MKDRYRLNKIKPTVAHNDAILQVGGKIGCMELVVLDPSNKWADYVFEKGYKLDKIEEVEQYIKESWSFKKHSYGQGNRRRRDEPE